VWSFVKSLDPPPEMIPRTQFTTCLPKKKLISKKNASCLTYIFQIGAEVRESSLVINPIHKHV
jgi:hypothetical protein